ncbi:MAG: AEC family transporter [Anaerolineales bacterium]|nr:AEC family transporter [Anaerolineales bacterium]
MIDLLILFRENLLPILLIAAAGFVLGKLFKIPPRALSQVIFYIFSPALVFRLLTQSQLSNQDILKTIGFATLFLCILAGLTWTLGKLIKLDRKMMAAVLLTALFMNAGNYGLPVVNFAFGATALAYASLFFVATATYTNSVGVVIASSGSTSVLQAIKGLLKLPSIFGLILGIIVVRMGWELPSALDRTINLLADASIPSMLVLLGLQFVNLKLDGQIRPLILVTTMRLLVAPILAIGLSRIFALTGPAYQATVLEAGMPTAVLTTVLATEFDSQPSFVTTVVFVTTLLSPLTLTPLLYFLGA